MTTEIAEPKQNLPAIAEPRLPYHPGVESRFGIDQTSWRALVESTFPTASTSESVILALSYCKARNLDPFKRVVHIVPIWDKHRKCLVDTVWPGIAEYRTTAFRTGVYAGKDATEVGPTKSERLGKSEVDFPEWMTMTVYRLVGGQRIAFPGPRVYWKETFSATKDGSPNTMWKTRPFGMLEKCAEAAALRCAFPEELGGDLCAEEIDRTWHGRAAVDVVSTPVADTLTPKPAALPEPATPTVEPVEPVEPESSETVTEDAPEQQPILQKYSADIAAAITVNAVNAIAARAKKDERLTDDTRFDVITWTEEQIVGIQSQS